MTRMSPNMQLATIDMFSHLTDRELFGVFLASAIITIVANVLITLLYNIFCVTVECCARKRPTVDRVTVDRVTVDCPEQERRTSPRCLPIVNYSPMMTSYTTRRRWTQRRSTEQRITIEITLD